MNNLYVRLAKNNLKNNKSLYVPYMVAGMITVLMFYIMMFINNSAGLEKMRGAFYITTIMSFGVIVVGVFSYIYIFYTNSFISKRRKKEMGIYNILGMEKRHIAKVLAIETVFTAFVSIVGGIVAGILFSKLALMLIYRILGIQVTIEFSVPPSAVKNTVLVFGILYMMTLFYNLMQMKLANPVELLRGSSVGEKEPKTKWLMAILGVVCLGAGYAIAITTEQPMKVISLFFVAVLLVIAGTYMLFTAGSIAVLKLLRKTHGFYYKKKHFIAVSTMMYRMKQNAAGLAGICILSTMVMVTIGASLCIFSGVGEGVRQEYPREYFLQMHYSEDLKPETYQDTTSDVKKLVEAQMEENGSRVENMLSYTRCNMVYRKGKDGYEAEMGDLADTNDYENLVYVQYLLREDYEANTGKKIEIPDDVAAFYESEEGLIPGETLLFGDYSIKGKRLEEPVETAVASRYSGIKKRVQVLLPGIEEMEKLTESLGKNFETYYGLEEGEGPGAMYFLGWNWYFDISGKQEPAEEFLEKLRSSWETEKASEWAYISTFQNRTEEEEYLFQEYGTILFIGFFLGLIFLLATVLIIYYKQVTEGYDDRKRFVIMQDIGLSQAEVKKTIRTQVLLVFFLPLGAAGLHMAMAFKVLVKMMALFSAYNIKLFSLCIGLTVAVFALVYFLVYTVTARIYYKIVSNVSTVNIK